MRFAPLDELDDLPPPLTQPGRSASAARLNAAGEPGRAAGTARLATSRLSPLACNAPPLSKRAAARLRSAASSGSPARDSARAKLTMAIQRGKLAKGPCTECGAANVTAYMADPRQPLEDNLLRAVSLAATRTGLRGDQIIEGRLRAYLGFELLDRVGARLTIAEADVLALAYRKLH